MSELSCDTPFIGRNETLDLSRYHLYIITDEAALSFNFFIDRLDCDIMRVKLIRRRMLASLVPRPLDVLT